MDRADAHDSSASYGVGAMRHHSTVFVSFLLLVPVLLPSCVHHQPDVAAKALTPQEQFEQQIEEGFGRLDLLPQTWVMLPKP